MGSLPSRRTDFWPTAPPRGRTKIRLLLLIMGRLLRFEALGKPLCIPTTLANRPESSRPSPNGAIGSFMPPTPRSAASEAPRRCPGPHSAGRSTKFDTRPRRGATASGGGNWGREVVNRRGRVAASAQLLQVPHRARDTVGSAATGSSRGLAKRADESGRDEPLLGEREAMRSRTLSALCPSGPCG